MLGTSPPGRGKAFGRLIAAPTVYPEAILPLSQGPGPDRPAKHGEISEIRREGQLPIPSGPSGHLPLIRGVVLPYGFQGYLPSLGRGAPWGSRQNCTGSVGSAKAGAAVETLRLQFLQTQGPVARENTRTATQILRAGNSPPPYRYASPVMGSGESSPMDLGEAKRSRSPSDASPAAFW